MKAALVLVGVFLILLLGIGGIFLSGYISATNNGAKEDAQLKAQYQNMENVLSGYSLKVTEAAQLPAMYTKGLEDVAKAAIQGRYGANGSQATMQWIKEQNPTVDPKLYLKIEQIIEGGRDNFQNEQTRFLDMKRSYETDLNSFPSGFFYRLAGFPKIPLDSYKLISSEHAEETFKTGTDKGIKLTQ